MFPNVQRKNMKNLHLQSSVIHPIRITIRIQLQRYFNRNYSKLRLRIQLQRRNLQILDLQKTMVYRISNSYSHLQSRNSAQKTSYSAKLKLVECIEQIHCEFVPYVKSRFGLVGNLPFLEGSAFSSKDRISVFPEEIEDEETGNSADDKHVDVGYTTGRLLMEEIRSETNAYGS
ncbi:hypothetical protein L1887_28606 [Cichorium endivia]|nr:hypothetical protein L1887_28606 [Cichorium endivia]